LKKGRNPQSILRRLPLVRQTEIVARVEDGLNTIAVAGELAKEGIPVSRQMLNDFCEWFLIREKLGRDGELALGLVQTCKENGWIKSARQERAAAQLFFNRSVLAKRDPEKWAMVEKINLAIDKQALEKEKVALLKRQLRGKDGKNKKNMKDGTGATPVSDEEKEAAIRQIYGMSP
jgi:hypothetical protein